MVLPFLVSLLSNDKVEIHDVSSLIPLQLIDVTSPLCVCRSASHCLLSPRPDCCLWAGCCFEG